jgi:hypothetical protein
MPLYNVDVRLGAKYVAKRTCYPDYDPVYYTKLNIERRIKVGELCYISKIEEDYVIITSMEDTRKNIKFNSDSFLKWHFTEYHNGEEEII